MRACQPFVDAFKLAMSRPLLFFARPEIAVGKVSQVVNRNGEVVPFRRNRVVRAILAAVRAAGSKDEWVADKLADMVVYFLDAQHGDGPAPSADDVDDTIERALLSSPELTVIAQSFIAGRRQRREIRELQDAAPDGEGPQVTQHERGVGSWDRARIAAALMRENGLDATPAMEVAEAVEQKVNALQLPRITTGLVRELADVELLSRGLSREPGGITVPRYDLEQWVFPGDETDAPPVPHQAALSDRAARRVLGEYTLHNVLPASSRDAHMVGSLHFEALHAPASLRAVRLDAPALLRAGAGFGLQRLFAEAAAGTGAVFARLSGVVSALRQVTSGSIVLRGLDRALSASEDAELDRAAIQNGLRLLAAHAGSGLILECGPPGSASRDLATRILIDALASEEGSLRQQAGMDLWVNAGAFADPARRSLVERACAAASFCGVPAFRLRDSVAQTGQGLFGESAGAIPHSAVLARAGLNLVHGALDLAAGALPEYLARLDEQLSAAADGLAAMVTWLERAAMRDLPDPAPSAARMLRALVGSTRDVQLVPIGLGIAAGILGGDHDPASAAWQRTAQQVLSYLGFKFGERSARRGLAGSLGATIDDGVCARLAREDAARLARIQPDAPLRLRLAAAEAYRPGAALDASTPISARLEPESALHGLLGRDAECGTGNDESPTAAAVMQQLRDCLSEGGPQPVKVAVTVRARTCRDCGTRFPAHRDSCPVCGSTSWAVPPGQRSLFGG